MVLFPSSIDPLHCALSFGHCLSFPNVGSSGEGEGRNLGAGARTPGLEWGFGFGGGGWHPRWEDQQKCQSILGVGFEASQLEGDWEAPLPFPVGPLLASE